MATRTASAVWDGGGLKAGKGTFKTTGGINGATLGQPLRSPQPDRALEGIQMEEVLREAINTLDEEHRLVVILRDIEDLSIEEICEITDLPDGTVKSRLHRARLALRKKLQKHVS